MNLNPGPSAQVAAEIARLEDDALRAMQQGRERDALAAWQRLLALAPQQVRALTQAGQLVFRLSDFAAARDFFAKAAAADGRDPRQWTNLAFACQRLGDDAAEADALFRATVADPADLLALLLRGQWCERHGKAREAAAMYGAAAAVSPPLDRLTPELRPAVAHAMGYRQKHLLALGEHVDQSLDTAFKDCAGADLDRFRLSVDIMLGRKRRSLSQPLQFFYPGLLPIEFFPREQFPWLDGFEAATDAIRDELLAVLAADQGLDSYINYRADQPLNQWAELNHSLKWSAFHLVKDGQVVADHAARCPRTMAQWATAPAPDQPGRTPSAMFSVLKPHTHIPAHVGSSNVRLVTHLPLIVPPGCRFRVGNTVREWVPGRAWVFDDTIEHEAWNDSDELRCVLIFDIWHPALSPEERHLIKKLSESLNEFNGGAAGDAPL